MKRKEILWELLLFFERNRLENVKTIWDRAKKLNLCSRPTFYRYHKRWIEADNKLKVIERKLWEENK